MADMVDDVRLFDSRDETIRPSETGKSLASYSRGTAETDAKAWNNTDFMTGVGNTTALRQADQLLNLDFHSMPVYDIQEYIGNLDQEKQKLLNTADSLASIADTYERKAKQLRISIEASPK